MEPTAKEIYASIRQHERMSVLRSMDYLIRMMNHEDAYEIWILVVPDEADECDFMDIAQDDEEYESVCRTFVKLVKQYGRYGW